MAIIAHRLVGHLQNGNVSGLLEKTATALNGHVAESSKNQLDRLIQDGNWSEAVTLIANLVTENEKNQLLIKRLEMILFFHERRQNVLPAQLAKPRSSTDEDERISDADISFLEGEASLFPELETAFVIDAEKTINETNEPITYISNADTGHDYIASKPSSSDTDNRKKITFQDEIDGIGETRKNNDSTPEDISRTEAEHDELDTDTDDQVVNFDTLTSPADRLAESHVYAKEDTYLEEPITDELIQEAELLPGDSNYQIDDTLTLADIEAVDHDFGDEYAAYAYDPDEIYDAIEDQKTVFETSISREERARQVAAGLLSRTGWTPDALPLLQQIFYISGWGATRVSLEREINQGLSLDELILASHLKASWSDNEKYWIAFDRNGNGRFSHYILSWPTALLVVRTFDAMPQLEELEVFVEDIYEHWIDSPHLTRAFRSFSRYLWFRTARLEGCLPPNEPFNFESPHLLPEEEYSDLGYYDSTRHEVHRKLNELGTKQATTPRKDGISYGAWCDYAELNDLDTIEQVMNDDAIPSTDYDIQDYELDTSLENDYDY